MTRLIPFAIALLASNVAHAEPQQGDSPLVMPAAKRCLSQPLFDDLDDDTGYWASNGLSQEEVALSMDAFLPELARCVPAGTSITAEAELDMTVACNGRVAAVNVGEPRGLTPGMSACISNTMRYAAFPAHDVQGGFSFSYRLRLMFVAPPSRR